jgi:hypothetical protein
MQLQMLLYQGCFESDLASAQFPHTTMGIENRQYILNQLMCRSEKAYIRTN